MIASRVRGWGIVGLGRRWNEGRGVSLTNGQYWDALARVCELRAARWYPRAFGCVFGFGRPSTHSHQAYWLDCMGRRPGGHHRTSNTWKREEKRGQKDSSRTVRG